VAFVLFVDIIPGKAPMIPLVIEFSNLGYFAKAYWAYGRGRDHVCYWQPPKYSGT
jgi:hypothetical protein